jgi:gamma-glutamylaminecyclotransferase
MREGDAAIRFFICGSALSDQPDRGSLGGALLICRAKTAEMYRMHSVKQGWHPGVYEVSEGGVALEGELYELTPEQHRNLLAAEPPDLYEASIVLDDGSFAQAMLYPRELVEEHRDPDISRYGGWSAFKRDPASS